MIQLDNANAIAELERERANFWCELAVWRFEWMKRLLSKIPTACVDSELSKLRRMMNLEEKADRLGPTELPESEWDELSALVRELKETNRGEQ